MIRFRTFRQAAVVLGTAVLLASCGGGNEVQAPAAAAQSAPDRRPLAAGDTITANELFDWAEGQLPQFFAPRAQTRTLAPFVYRFYSDTGNYIGVDGQTVYLLGPLSGGGLLAVGTLGSLACNVKFASCDAPTVTAGPQDLSLAPGATANFSAAIGGGPSITTQWLRNDVPIAGASGLTYSLLAQAADNGARFALRASNAKGTVTSAAATLSVARVVDAAAARALAQNHGCFSCHGERIGGVGPAFTAIGARYAGNAAILPTLVSRVRNGSSGNWPGFGSMPPQSPNQAEGEQIIEWILTLRP